MIQSRKSPPLRKPQRWATREHGRGIRAWSTLLILLLTAAICAAQQAKHYVVLVSLDGFRYDYATKYGAKNLLAMATRGASAPDGMIPSYPSLTFPNHFTIVTGLYPE